MVTTRTELATAAGEALCTSTSTIVVAGGGVSMAVRTLSSRPRSATPSAR